MIHQNTLYTGDCLHVMHGLNSESVDLIYLDPPFNSKKMYKAPIGSKAAGSSFNDMWSWQDVDTEYLEELIEQYPFMVQFIQATGTINSSAMKAYLTYMAQRLLEMKRLLKSSGSFYIHCDPTASHYLKIICDRIFGQKNFKNEIIWKRTSSHNDSKVFGKVSDTILMYGGKINSDEVRVPLNPEYLKKFYRHDDAARGKFRVDNLSAKGLSGGGYMYDFHGHPGPWRYPKKSMLKLQSENRIYLPKKIGGVPALKRFLNENKGQVPTSIWTDIPPIQSQSEERTGYPTQKPLALLNRIIKASSKPGDLVLDPFCGCATTCVAAQQLSRKWIGIDISEKSASLVTERLSDDEGLFKNFVHTKKYPVRSDLKPVEITTNVRQRLYKDQKQKCNACETEMDLRHFELDHIIPKAKNGGDYYKNYQLLCGSCNRIKGDRPMAYLMMRINKINRVMKYKVSFDSGYE